MVHSFISQFALCILLVTSTFAFFKASVAERLGAILVCASWLGADAVSFFLKNLLSQQNLETTLLVMDGALALGVSSARATLHQGVAGYGDADAKRRACAPWRCDGGLGSAVQELPHLQQPLEFRPHIPAHLRHRHRVASSPSRPDIGRRRDGARGLKAFVSSARFNAGSLKRHAALAAARTGNFGCDYDSPRKRRIRG